MRWLADENFNNDIVRALFRRNPVIDLVRAQEDILLLTECSLPGEWEGQVIYLPLR